MIRSRGGRRLRAAAPLGMLAAVALAVTACTGPGTGGSPGGSPGESELTASRVKGLVADLPQRSLAPPPTMRLASGLAPPTNRWFSGLVFGDAPNPVFPFPIWFDATEDGFAAALPTASSTATSIGTSVENRLSVGLGATRFQVSAYDAVSATLEYRAGKQVLGTATIAEGSPVVFYTAARTGTVTVSGSVQTGPSAGRGTVRVGDQDWAVVTSQARIDGTRILVRKGSTVALFPVPAGSGTGVLGSLMDAARSPLTGVATSYSSVEGGQRTTLGYRTRDRADTLLVPLPHQGRAAGTCTEGAYRTIYGTVPLCVGSRLQFATPTAPARAALDLGSVPEPQKAELRRSLAADVAALPEDPADTYFGGKALYRAAMLLQLARQLGDTAAEKTLTASLVRELDAWMDPQGCRARDSRCFVYDPALKTVVGRTASFGSELGNDHHFHYGYFLYAAGVVAQDSPKLARSWAPVMDLL
ncbi:MAG: 1,3-beta-glucanase, partial [Micrococcales bacterium]|nr:1,3-beta-glucanase [Micrococcales bacterium]